MGLPENPTGQPENQVAGRRKQLPRRPRMRRCLLKGCEQQYHPERAQQRYCSEGCRAEADHWAQYKAQQRYREKQAGKEKRNSQSKRYRERVRHRKRAEKEAEKEAVEETARVIPEDFFRGLLRPARLLRRSPATAGAKSLATLLLPRLPARPGARSAARAALERGLSLIRNLLPSQRHWPYSQLSHATGVSPTRLALATPAPTGAAALPPIAGLAGRSGPTDTDCRGPG